jgi:hypothetical protein
VTADRGTHSATDGTWSVNRPATGGSGTVRGRHSGTDGTWQGVDMAVPFEVTWVGPPGPGAYGGSIRLVVKATDPFGLSQLALLVNGLQAATMTRISGPYYQAVLDTRLYADASSLNLQVQATNTRSQVTLTPVVTVTAQNQKSAPAGLNGRITGGS